MALVAIPGTGAWLPPLPSGILGSNVRVAADITLDADDEEVQLFFRVTLAGGGTKTFGTAGSSLAWLPGATVTFASGSTLRLGLKTGSKINLVVGNPPRATIGAAAFDVYTDLVGGAVTLTSLVWRTDAMTSGTPLTLTDGDLIAVCLHLDSTSGTPNVKMRMGGSSTGVMSFPAATLVTTGPAYAGQAPIPNLLLTCDDGTLAWGDPSSVFSVLEGTTGALGQGNTVANLFRLPAPCAIDMLAGAFLPAAGADYALVLVADPLGTPTLIEAVTHDAHLLGVANALRFHMQRLTQPRVLAADTDYAIGLRQETAASVAAQQYDVAHPTHFRPNGLDETCYGALSTGGATFVPQNSGMRRYLLWARVSHMDNGVSAGGGGLIGRSLIAGAS